MIDYTKALEQLVQDNVINPEWTCGETYESIVCSPKPSEDVFNNAYLKWKTLNSYKQLRKQDYPSIPEQLDLIFHSGIDAWKTRIQQTKDKYPKPNENT